MNKKTQLVLASLSAALVAAGCASGPSVAELNDLTEKIVKADGLARMKPASAPRRKRA